MRLPGEARCCGRKVVLFVHERWFYPVRGTINACFWGGMKGAMLADGGCDILKMKVDDWSQGEETNTTEIGGLSHLKLQIMVYYKGRLTVICYFCQRNGKTDEIPKSLTSIK